MADRLDDQGLATVFGGSGFIGRYAVAALAKEGQSPGDVRDNVCMPTPHAARDAAE